VKVPPFGKNKGVTTFEKYHWCFDRTDLILLAQQIERECDEAELARLIALFDHFVPHPAASDLFLFPELEFGEHAYPGAEAIVDAALGYVDPYEGAQRQRCDRRHRRASADSGVRQRRPRRP
jgi:hypothetical protein